MQVIRTPGDFPGKIGYWIIDPDDHWRHLKFLLRQVQTTSVCLGRLTEPDHPSLLSTNDAFALLINRHWAQHQDVLLANGFPAERILVMPITPGDPWGYWDFTFEHFQRVGYETRSLRFNPKEFIGTLAGKGMVTLENGEVNVSPGGYTCFTYDVFVQENPELPQRIKSIITRLDDHNSRKVFDLKIFGKPLDQWSYFWKNQFRYLQYFDYVPIRPGDVIINGGVLGGYELPMFLALMQGRGMIHNVDPLGFDFLTSYCRASIDHYPHMIQTHALAFSDRDGEVSFPVSVGTMGPQALGRFKNTSLKGLQQVTAPCLTVDSFVEKQKPERVDLIKFDLEGAEQHILPGMMQTVGTYRPSLAVSIYHNPRHLWNLTEYLMTRLENYRFFVNGYEKIGKPPALPGWQ